MLTNTLARLCLFFTLTTFLVAIVIIILKCTDGVTGINIQNFNPNCSDSYSNAKFSNISPFLIVSFLGCLFALISSLGMLIILYLYLRKLGPIGNDQKD